MTDHTAPMTWDLGLSVLGKSLSATLEQIRKAFAGAHASLGIIGDSAHLNHYHIHTGERYGMTGIQRAIVYAQDDLWDAEWSTDGEYRHRAVKAARDELRRLRKLEVRQLGWHR